MIYENNLSTDFIDQSVLSRKILTYLSFSLNLRYQYLVLIFQIGNIN